MCEDAISKRKAVDCWSEQKRLCWKAKSIIRGLFKTRKILSVGWTYIVFHSSLIRKATDNNLTQDICLNFTLERGNNVALIKEIYRMVYNQNL